jgi:FlaA1/EpsC-like NDP-sugar epimerase
MLPRTYETLSQESVALDDLTDVDVLDLVGRRPVKHDLEQARAALASRRVLVTGAAGSIGSRLTAQLLTLGASDVVGVDWWEHGVFQLHERWKDAPNARFEVADVKNEIRMRRIFERHRPDLVFHCAAYKHVPLMQHNPSEAVLNNVGGTDMILRLAAEYGVRDLTVISTDKAVNPVNILGATKRMGEILALDLAERYPGTRVAIVRFGNVIQSNGSVMETFRRQLRAGGPLTVTDPEVTRYFMTIDEASQLIIQSMIVASSGEICVLDMGEPIRIIELARSLIKLVAPGTQIEITGLRPGEKLFEELSYDPALVAATSNAKIFVMRESEKAVLDAAQIRRLVDDVASGALADDDVIPRLRDAGFALQ